MEIPKNALRMVADAINAGWLTSMEAVGPSRRVVVELDDGTNQPHRRIVAVWINGNWDHGLMINDMRLKPRKLRNAGEVRRYLRGEIT